MKNKLVKYFQNTFVRNVIVLASGTAVAQLLNILFTPLITRIYGPEVYGLMGTFQSIINIISPVAALSYPIAIVLPKEDSEAKNIARLSIYITMLLTIITQFIIIFFKQEINNIINLGNSLFLYILPPILFTAGLLQVNTQWLMRKGKFKVSAKADIGEVVFTNFGKLFFGLNNPLSGVLILFTSLRQGIKSLLIYIFSDKRDNEFWYNKISKKHSLVKLAKKYSDFPLFRAPETLFNSISGNIPLLSLSVLFGPETVGFYSLALSVLGAPVTLISNSVGNVFYPKVTEAANNGENITRLVIKATSQLALIAIFPFGLIFLFGPELFSIIFGDNWITAGTYAKWLTLWSYTTFINRPSVHSLPVLSKQKFLLGFTISSFFFKIIGLLLGFYVFKDDLVAIMMFSIAGSLSNLFLIIKTLKLTSKFDKKNSVLTDIPK